MGTGRAFQVSPNRREAGRTPGRSNGLATWAATALAGLNAVAFTLLVSQYFGSGLADRPLALRHSSEALATAVPRSDGVRGGYQIMARRAGIDPVFSGGPSIGCPPLYCKVPR